MENRIYNEQNGLWYELQNDYYLPCLARSDEEQVEIELWGQRHLRYLKQHRKVLYYNLLTSGNLNGYLADIDKQAENMFYRLLKELAEKENVTEQLKSTDQMLWVQKKNNIRNRATEIVNAEIIYKV